MKDFFKRINYQGKLDDISLSVCQDFQLGDFVSNELITLGYEDFNFVLETNKGKYFVKVFSSFRTKEDCQRYMEIMLRVNKEGISFPSLFRHGKSSFYTVVINNTKLRLCVMEYIDGQSYFFLGRKPDASEIKFLANQAALINSIDIKPKFVYDSWAITSFLKEFEKKKKYLAPEDLKMIKPLTKEFEKINIQTLPHCFMHGDIIVTNTMKDKNNKIWIIDFAVSNYYPRIQELAVFACNLLFDENDKSKTENNLKVALEEYQKIIKLTPKELKILPTYIKFAHAMHVLSATYESVAEKNDSEENKYWLNQGRTGLYRMVNA